MCTRLLSVQETRQAGGILAGDKVFSLVRFNDACLFWRAAINLRHDPKQCSKTRRQKRRMMGDLGTAMRRTCVFSHFLYPSEIVVNISHEQAN